MQKLRLLKMLVLVIAFLLSWWVIPVVMVTIAFTLIETLWIKITLCVVATLWLLIFHPWTIFLDPRFGDFLTDMRRAFNTLIN